jgi:hypothetical protein
MKAMTCILTGVLVLSVAACGGSGKKSPFAGEVPLYHRPSDAQCSTTAPPANCSGAAHVSCTSDSDCTAGADGRCIGEGGGPVSNSYCLCTYDTCMHDTDCPSGQVCACHGSTYMANEGNFCSTGNCRVDTDCGPGGYCSPSPVTVTCGGAYLAGYYCHSAADVCINGSDCQEPGGSACVYSTTDARWQCGPPIMVCT